ncbi:outer membrane beta-barrel protein [Aureivirga sp. CE67]|uniref:outer membrane beta-barrel protein n=1 Tax=Aureivirga sp. CE67 TaxID=1788983 RepID=UPI0018C995EB|nr:outer membrane beta-barrel protein [Aureivirga sp. CE67]
MKRILMTLVFVIGALQFTNAQIGFGAKAGLNFGKTGDFSAIGQSISADNKTGYSAGVWLRVKVPVIGLYVRPELSYVRINSEYDVAGKRDYSLDRFDIPVLFGTKILKIGNIFVGPNFQYAIGNDFKFDDIKETDSSDFSVGLVIGAGVELGKFGVDIRWEKGLSDSTIEYIDNNSNTNFKFDNKTEQISINLSYRLFGK